MGQFDLVYDRAIRLGGLWGNLAQGMVRQFGLRGCGAIRLGRL